MYVFMDGCTYNVVLLEDYVFFVVALFDLYEVMG